MEDGATTFTRNKYAWNLEATMIYIESPAGVGFSICTDTDCTQDDDKSATDNLAAVLDLLTNKFPELQANDLYIAGESYAGIYVPKLTALLDKYITDNTGK